MSGNPLRWVCKDDGCFNVRKRPKIEVFAECFGRGINFGDVDGLVERRDRFLMLEWKSSRNVPVGQRLLHDAILRLEPWTIVLVCGDPETMHVESFEVRRLGSVRRGVGLDALKTQIRGWYRWADAVETTA